MAKYEKQGRHHRQQRSRSKSKERYEKYRRDSNRDDEQPRYHGSDKYHSAEEQIGCVFDVI